MGIHWLKTQPKITEKTQEKIDKTLEASELTCEYQYEEVWVSVDSNFHLIDMGYDSEEFDCFDVVNAFNECVDLMKKKLLKLWLFKQVDNKDNVKDLESHYQDKTLSVKMDSDFHITDIYNHRYRPDLVDNEDYSLAFNTCIDDMKEKIKQKISKSNTNN